MGEPINEEAWHWYDENIGKRNVLLLIPGGRLKPAGLISNLAGVTPAKPTFATLPLPGIQPVLVDENGKKYQVPMLHGWCIFSHHPMEKVRRGREIFASNFHGRVCCEQLMEIMNAAG